MPRNNYRRARNNSSAWLVLLTIIAAIAAAICYAAISGPAHDPNIKVVVIPLGRDIKISPSIAPNGIESFQEAVDRLHPLAVINGTYYDENDKPLGDIVIDGKVVNRGGQKNAIAVTKDGEVRFLRRDRNKFDWKGYRAALAAGPRLVHKGKMALDPVADGFKRSSLKIEAWRSGVGKTSDGRLLLVTAKKSLTLAQFAKVMLDLGSVEAMNLDGGGACGLYHKGRYLTVPMLHMTNVLAVCKTK